MAWVSRAQIDFELGVAAIAEVEITTNAKSSVREKGMEIPLVNDQFAFGGIKSKAALLEGVACRQSVGIYRFDVFLFAVSVVFQKALGAFVHFVHMRQQVRRELTEGSILLVGSAVLRICAIAIGKRVFDGHRTASHVFTCSIGVDGVDVDISFTIFLGDVGIRCIGVTRNFIADFAAIAVLIERDNVQGVARAGV